MGINYDSEENINDASLALETNNVFRVVFLGAIDFLRLRLRERRENIFQIFKFFFQKCDIIEGSLCDMKGFFFER